jgi:hypothetical protein
MSLVTFNVSVTSPLSFCVLAGLVFVPLSQPSLCELAMTDGPTWWTRHSS